MALCPKLFTSNWIILNFIKSKQLKKTKRKKHYPGTILLHPEQMELVHKAISQRK